MIDIGHLDYQRHVFADRLNRFQLSKVKPRLGGATRRVRVTRNHGFELVASVLPSFLAISDLNVDLDVGDYDDSLSFADSDAQAEIVWVDFDRYARLDDESLARWFLSRLGALRASARGPLLVANDPARSARARTLNDALANWSKATPATAVFDLAAISETLGPLFFDDRRSSLTGTRFSDAACLESARVLGLRLLPAAFLPRIKAIALDLDNTLYSGVLGEDSASGLVLTQEHRDLQESLCGLAERGVLLAVVSRNERADVDELFRIRSDFPLKPRHISSWQVSWGDKSRAIRRAAEELRIGTDAFLLVDDNLGEIAAVSAELPHVKLLFAGFSPAGTAAALRHFPALWSSETTETDAIRAGDLAANAVRDDLAESLSPVEYLKSLDVKLTFALDPRADLGRLHEICVKTNQFNLALARLSEVQVGEYLEAAEHHVVHVRLADRLADSGSVAALFARRYGKALVVDELCISCRAMGRMLEDIIVTEAVAHVAERFGSDSVRFVHAVGPRNQPARRWLGAYAGFGIGESGGVVDLPWNGDRVERFVKVAPVRITWME